MESGEQMTQQPVIASVDGSEKTARAIAVGAAIANLAGAELEVLRVIAVPSERLLAQAGTIGVDDAAVTGRRDAERELAAAIGGVRLRDGRHATFEVLEENDVPAAIIDHAARRNARALVLATRAPRSVERAIAGSVADRVLRESPVPVALVPPGAAFLAGKDIQLARVLVPQDGSSLAFRSLEFLIGLPNARDLEYVLFQVVFSEDDRDSAQQQLHDSAAWLRARGARSVEAVVAEASNAADAIVGAVREVLPDFIAMSTRGQSGLGRLILGSVAEGVIRGSELPVFLLTPKMLAH
jgi:nucleotide-binding universal stress UspA family protein